MMMSEPAVKKGWLRKQSRGGLVRNWQNRFFVLSKGRISYYAKELDHAPYGDELKGALHLLDAKVSDDKKYGNKNVYIVSANGQKDMLMEASSVEEAESWVRAINAHIAFAPRADRRDSTSPPGTSTGSFISPGLVSQPSQSFTGSEDLNVEARGSDEKVPSTSGTDVIVVPKPGWVIKVFRTNGEKIFINLCEHSEVPHVPLVLSLGYNKWPFMVLTPPRTIQDGAEKADVTVYDAVVNPQVVTLCNKDNQAKDAACARVMRLLKKQNGEDLQAEFKLPKITKRYKGEVVAVHLPASALQQNARNRSSVLIPAGRSLGRSNSLNPATATRDASLASASADADITEDTDSGKKTLGSRSNSNSTSMRLEAAAAPVAPIAMVSQAATTYSPPPASAPAPAPAPSTDSATATGGGGGSVKAARGNMYSSTSFRTPPGQSVQVAPVDSVERRTTISRLFLNLEDGSSVAVEDGRFNRVHSEVPFSVAQDVRAGNTRAIGGRASVLNPLVDKQALQPAALANPAQAVFMQNNVAVPKKFVVPYQIVRFNGVIAKSQPEKAAPGKILGQGVKVFVVARRVTMDAVWYATTEGWVAVAPGPTPQPTLIPALHGQPTMTKIVSTRFEDISVSGGHPRMSMAAVPRESGWFMFGAAPSQQRQSLVSSVPFQTRFSMDIFHIDNAVLRISRTFSEVLDLRDALVGSPLKVVKDRASKAGSLPFEEDGLQEFVDDVNSLLALVEGVDAWLNKIMQLQVSLAKCKPLADFLQPRERLDFELMENELMAREGLNGAWKEELEKGF